MTTIDQRRVTATPFPTEQPSVPTVVPLTRRQAVWLYAAVFVGGMSTLAIEFAASRLLGSVFGSSNLVWANVIGLILLYLTLGYFIGGRWADRSPRTATLYTALVWAAFLSALIPLLARPVLVGAARAVMGAQAGLAIGSFIVVLVLFSVPITLLGTVSPFAVRLAVTDVAHAGRVSGRLYALSTLGSLLGTFSAVLVAIPLLGTTWTFMLFAGALYSVALVGLVQARGARALMWLWMPVMVGVGLWAASTVQRPIYDGATLLFEGESAYNYIQVQEDANGYRYLFLNEGQGVHSQWHASELFYGRTWDMFLAAPYVYDAPQPPAAVLVVGLAAGTIARQHHAVYPGVIADGIEIDPLVVDVGVRYFDMTTAAIPGLGVVVGDGRAALGALAGPYDLVAIDAYRPPYIPWHLTTREYFASLRARLSDQGVLAINVGRTPSDRRLVHALTATLQTVFPTVHTVDVPGTFNTMLYASVRPTPPDGFQTRLAVLPADTHPAVREVLAVAAAATVPTVASDVVFTDERAPVEWLVDSLVLNFLLSDDLDLLRPAAPEDAS